MCIFYLRYADYSVTGWDECDWEQWAWAIAKHDYYCQINVR